MPLSALDTDDAPIWIMAVPPASLKSFDSYVQTLASKHKTSPVGVVTEISLDETNTFASPRFKVIRPLKGPELGTFMSRREDAQTRLLVEPDVSKYVAPKTGARRR
jgi:hypothetical protein